jgi:membrane-bound serine protease (ClpP class)
MTAAARFRLILYLSLILTSLALPFVSVRAQETTGAGHVDLVNATGDINPAFQSYVERGITAAEDDGALALVIRLDTPGGSVDVMEDIVKHLTAANVPIVVYVAPTGAHAASAGTFITLAGHVAAMAPGTSIGAASPVGPNGETLTGTIASKVTNILVSDIEGLTRRRGQKAMDWARQAVEQARAATETEALQLGLIDVVAPDVPTLLKDIDGRQVDVAGVQVTLHTTGAEIQPIDMNLAESFLAIITNPNVAFLLMVLGINGLLFELSSPGAYVPGVVGAISLVLALYAFGTLPVNYAGVLFIVLAFILFIFDVKAPTHGVLTIAGVASFVFGSIILFNSPLYVISRGLIVTVAVCTGGFFAFAVAKVVAARSRPVTTGREQLVGMWAEARTELAPEGMVYVRGELWSAIAQGAPIRQGERVKILARHGFKLMVEKGE